MNYTATIANVLDHLRQGGYGLDEHGCLRTADGTCPIVGSTGGQGEDADQAGKLAGYDPEAVNELIAVLDNLPDADASLRSELVRAAGLVMT